MKKRLMALAATLALLVPANAAHAEEGVGLWTVGHVQGIGWMDPSTEMVGTTGLGLRLEAIDFGEYPVAEARGHVQNIGWQAWTQGQDQRIGTVGQSLRMEAVQIRGFWGKRITCQAHVESLGWLPPVGDGEVCGTTGRGLRLEAVRFRVKDAPAG